MSGKPCSICGRIHQELGVWVEPRPDPWLALSDGERRQGLCDFDLCKTPDGQCFIRTVLELPLIGGPQATFEFGVWACVGDDDFRRYYETYNDDDQSRLGAMAGWLANDLDCFSGSFGLKATLLPQDDGQRPLMRLDVAASHLLARAQRQGIALQQALEIIHSTEVAA